MAPGPLCLPHPLQKVVTTLAAHPQQLTVSGFLSSFLRAGLGLALTGALAYLGRESDLGCDATAGLRFLLDF